MSVEVSSEDLARKAHIPETTADLEWADSIAIELSKFGQPGGKEELAAQLKHAISIVAFFYVADFGLSETEVDEQFEIAQKIFALPEQEKQPYRVDPNKQGVFGWKLKGSRKQQHCLVYPLEFYEDPTWNDIYGAEYARPLPLAHKAAKAERFQQHLHYRVLRRLLILCAIIMEVADEEALWKLHNYDSCSQCHLRYMHYHPRTPAELTIMKERNIVCSVYSHTDFGTFTFLMGQPVVGLQVRPHGAEAWKWLKPMKGSISVVADTLSFLTGGHLEGSIHRVVLPPEDQRHLPPYGVIHFPGPDDDTQLRPVQSPLLERLNGDVTGIESRFMPPDGVTAGDWVKTRFGSIDKNYANNKDNEVKVGQVGVASYA